MTTETTTDPRRDADTGAPPRQRFFILIAGNQYTYRAESAEEALSYFQQIAARCGIPPLTLFDLYMHVCDAAPPRDVQIAAYEARERKHLTLIGAQQEWIAKLERGVQERDDDVRAAINAENARWGERCHALLAERDARIAALTQQAGELAMLRRRGRAWGVDGVDAAPVDAAPATCGDDATLAAMVLDILGNVATVKQVRERYGATTYAEAIEVLVARARAVQEGE